MRKTAALIRVSLLAMMVSLPVFGRFAWGVAAQEDVPGARGSLYESPTFGWILIAPEPDWRIAAAGSAGGQDWVHLVADASDGADDFYFSFLDDGKGKAGCVQDLVDRIAATYPGLSLQGWHGPDVEFSQLGDPMAYVRVVRAQGPGLDVLASVKCNQMENSPLLIGEVLLETERDLDAGTIRPPSLPYWPGQWHTGHPAHDGTPANPAEQGVVLFGALDVPIEAQFPFNCNDQETFSPPAEPPPPDRGYFACAGQITNIDVVPTTVDLSQLVLGCERIPPGEQPPAGCTGDLAAPVAFDVLQAPSGADGHILTLQPGDVARVVLWYALPEGDVPLDIYYLEPGREPLVVAGSTFFTQGTGNRPKVRLSR